jgi:hypothetical protein
MLVRRRYEDGSTRTPTSSKALMTYSVSIYRISRGMPKAYGS